MKRILIHAEMARMDLKCKECQKSIAIGTLKLRIFLGFTDLHHFGNFHLNCYDPPVKHYIPKTDLVMRLDPENTKILNEWLENWNKNFTTPATIFSKSVNSSPSKYRRSWIEIFRFLDAVEVLKIYSQVNKEFYHISWDEELWHFYCLREYSKDLINNNEKSYRSQYIILRTECCNWCHMYLGGEYFYRCPLMGKPLCENCKTLKRFELMSKGEILGEFRINANILNIKFVEGCWGRKNTYRYMVEEAVESMCKRNKDFLIKILRENTNPILIDFIEKIDINKNKISIIDINQVIDEPRKEMCTMIYEYVKYGFHKAKLLKLLKKYYN
ncbi:unnamed protein product [Blepharisma stoltei]|uniref:PARP-type domain-containing protein n=1 Tax=Blepharisma stoltei TaxID=1481888 RepID=A0AAU9JTG3_9CILI|nr:unnamed protein product [Blepharisma stoltei]